MADELIGKMASYGPKPCEFIWEVVTQPQTQLIYNNIDHPWPQTL